MTDDSSACHKQRIGDDGRLYCTIAVTQDYPEPHEHRTSASFCEQCYFGEVYRAIKCRFLDGEVIFIKVGYDEYQQGTPKFFCTKKQDNIPHSSLKECETCTLRDDADFALPALETASYLEAVGCGEAAHHLREAFDILTAPDHAERDNEAAVNHAANALAAGFKFLSAKYGNETGRSNIEELWKEYVKASKYDPDANRYNFITNELVRKLQLIRHGESVAHPDPRTPTETETRFYYTLVSAILHYFVRKAGEEGKL